MLIKINHLSKIILISFIVIFIIFLIIIYTPFSKTKIFNSNKYNYDLEYYKELSEIPVISQETSYTCNVVSMAIIINYLGYEKKEHEIREDLNIMNRNKGMLPKEYLSYAKKVFKQINYSVSLKNPKAQTEILNLITASIERNLPLVIMYSTKDDFNNSFYNTHYAVIYGINMKDKKIMLSNPYGRLEVLSFRELYEGLEFTNYEKMPFSFRVGRKFGIINKNNIFTINLNEETNLN